MDLSINMKALFIPVMEKANMSKEGIFIEDKKSEEIAEKIANFISDLKLSKRRSLYVSLKAAIFDNFCNKFLEECEEEEKEAIVIHLGCGLDSRNTRVIDKFYKWYDIDTEETMEIRKKFFEESDNYKMISSKINDIKWIDEINETDKKVLIIAEGVTMNLTGEELQNIVTNIKQKFKETKFIFDAYSKFACKIAKIKKSKNKEEMWGIDAPEDFKNIATGITFNDTYMIYNEEKVNTLKGFTKFIFKYVLTGKITEKLYKIYSFDIVNRNF